MYKRADIMAYAKNHTQKGRFSIQRERERGSRTRRTHFRLYNSYSMRFAQTRKQKSKKVKRNPLAPMTGTRGSHVERRKLHLCSAAHLSAAAVSDGSKVLVSTPHRLTRPSSMAPSSLYLLPSIMYYTTNRTFCKVFLKIRLILYAATHRQLRFDFPRAPEFRQLRNFRRRCSFCPYFL